MLTSLTVQNFALIEKTEIRLHRGFTAVTGETGAGKSILFDALGFLLGRRAEAKVVREGQSKAIIEGEFEWQSDRVLAVLEEEGIDKEFPLIIRREIKANGRSRAFLNDTPVSISVLQSLSKDFIDLHQQNSLLELLEADRQLYYVDDFSGVSAQRKEYTKAYDSWQKDMNRLQHLQEQSEKAARDKEYYAYLLDEIDALNPLKGEEKTLEEKHQLAEHAEEIKRTLFQVEEALENHDQAVLLQLRQLAQQLGQSVIHYAAAEELQKRLQSVIIELEDMAQEAAQSAESVDLDPDEKQQISDRLDELNTLFLKHRISSTEELLFLRTDFEKKLTGLGNLDEEITELGKKVKQQKSFLTKEAQSLSDKRKEAAELLENKVLHIASKLGLPHAQLKVRFTKTEALTKLGIDKVQFEFSANKGSSVKPLKEVASGGELSRLMLAIKSVISGKNNLQTLIFDEIDSGISGDIAGRFGDLFKEMGKAVQVIAITHLPQVAARAQQHLHAEKHTEEHTASNVRYLVEDERIVETAKMLSSNKVTSAAKKMAEELLKN